MKIRKGKFTGHFFTNIPVPPNIAHRIRGYFPILESQMDTTNQAFAARHMIYADGVVVLYSIIKNGPVPIYRANVSIPPAVEGVVSAEFPGWGLESGLFGSTDIPTLIYTGTDLETYFASGGTDIPGRTPSASEYLNGIATLTDTTCDGTSYVGNWPDAPPDTTGGSYASSIFTTSSIAATATSNPIGSLYSGLMRLGVQVKTGSGKGISGICPFTSTDAGSHGLLIDTQTYTFWSVELNAAGATVRKLKLYEDATSGIRAECLRQSLVTGGLSAEDEFYFTCWLIADLVDAEETPIELLTAAEVADPYENGMVPIAHGWKFSRFTNKASIVTYRETVNGTIPCGESGMWTVEFSFAGDGTPSAVLTEDTAPTEFRINPAYHCLWWPANGKHNILRQALSSDPAQWSTFAGAVAPIYCWYDEDDIMQTITYEQYATSTPGSYPYFDTNGSYKGV